ncbi:MAG: ABC transporter substrate-binding protein [Spirochaetia bacterium]
MRNKNTCPAKVSTPLQAGAPNPGTISLGTETIIVRTALLLLFFLLAFLAGCGVEEPEEKIGTAEEEAAGGTAPPQTVSFTIAEQYGLAYAPLQVMRTRGILEERLEREVPEKNVEVSWVRLGNTAAIREAVLGGRVDAGFMGIPPFLIGYDRGMEWRIALGLSRAPLGLVTWRDDIRSLADFTEEDRIALPQPGSIQHILLTMACERVLGEADALDNMLVTLNHPDGMQALLAEREISAHFTSPPYIMEELSLPGMHQVLSGKEAMGGDFTFIVGAVTDKALTRLPEVCRTFVSSTAEAARWIEENPEEAAELLSREYDMEREKLSEYLGHEELVYGTEVLGVETFIDFMHRHGYLENRLAPEEVMEQ